MPRHGARQRVFQALRLAQSKRASAKVQRAAASGWNGNGPRKGASVICRPQEGGCCAAARAEHVISRDPVAGMRRKTDQDVVVDPAPACPRSWLCWRSPRRSRRQPLLPTKTPSWGRSPCLHAPTSAGVCWMKERIISAKKILRFSDSVTITQCIVCVQHTLSGYLLHSISISF